MTRLLLPLSLVPSLATAVPKVDFLFNDQGNFVTAAGRWDHPDYGDTDMTMAVKLFCTKNGRKRMCFEGRAYVIHHGSGPEILGADSSYYGGADIAAWSDALIVLTSHKDLCKTVQIVIDRTSKSVTRVTKQTKRTCPNQMNKDEHDSKDTLVGDHYG